MPGYFILNAAVGREKAVQAIIDVHRGNVSIAWRLLGDESNLHIYKGLCYIGAGKLSLLARVCRPSPLMR